jgi:hypothetical protein
MEALIEFDQVLKSVSNSKDELIYKVSSLFVLYRFDEVAVIGRRLIGLYPAYPVRWRIKAFALHLGSGQT